MALFQALLSIFAIIAVGFVCHKKKVLNASNIEGFEIFLFKIGMPCYLFSTAINYDLDMLKHGGFIYSYLASFLIIAFTVFFLFRHISYSRICIRIMASGYVNSAIYALPIITFLLNDPAAAVIGTLAQVMLIQPFIIASLSLTKHKESSLLRRLSTPLFTPITAMPVLGLLLNYFDVTLHPVIISVFERLGIAGPSLALFVFGLAIGAIKITRDVVDAEMLKILFLKNILHPILAFLIGNYIFKLEPYWLYSLVIFTSAPSGFITYLTAKQFVVDAERVRLMVGLTSIVSLLTVIFIVALINMS